MTVTDDVERAREEGVRILAEAADYPDNPDFVAAQRLAPYPRAPDTYTHERIAAALGAARREERERCARRIEARAIVLRDYGPRTPEGLLTAIAGAQVGALLDAAASLRSCAGVPPQLSAQTGGVGGSRPGKPTASTAAMRARIREFASPERDDFDRAVLMLLDDFERLLAFYEAARPGPWEGGHHFQEEDGYPGSLRPPKRGAL